MDTILKYFSDFTDLQLAQLKALGNLYAEWNEKINVISRKDIDSLYEKHILHSLSIAAVFSFSNNTQVVDLGCGGGFPGIPLAIYFPEVHFHLVDSVAKKLKVVETVASSIGLKNITTQHTRIEDIKNSRFDYVVSRAVAPLKDLWKWSKPLIRKSQSSNEENMQCANGLICLKGGDLKNEIYESRTRPHIFSLDKIYEESFFEGKYILFIPK